MNDLQILRYIIEHEGVCDLSSEVCRNCPIRGIIETSTESCLDMAYRRYSCNSNNLGAMFVMLAHDLLILVALQYAAETASEVDDEDRV